MRGSYGELFVYSLRKFGILCIGIYRFRDLSCTIAHNPHAKRYVITNPADDFRLMPTDKVSCRIKLKNINSQSQRDSRYQMLGRFRVAAHLTPPFVPPAEGTLMILGTSSSAIAERLRCRVG